MSTIAPTLDPSSHSANGRHPIWFLMGAIVGVLAASASIALVSWMVPGALGTLFFFPIFAGVMGAVMFMRGTHPLVPHAWPCIGFPLLVASALYLGGIGRPFVTPAYATTINMVVLSIVGVSLWQTHRATKSPPDAQTMRRSLRNCCLIIAAVILACITMTIAAYVVPIPVLLAVLPTVAASSFGAWLTVTLMALALIGAERAFPPPTTHSATACS